MSKFQLWNRDEYGQGTILYTSEELFDVIKAAKEQVTEENVNNALVADAKEQNWEVYFPLIASEVKTENNKYTYIYGGKGALNKDIFYRVIKSSGEISNIELSDIKKPVIRIYLGDISAERNKEKEWYASDVKGNTLDSLNRDELRDKSMLFVKIVD